MEDVPAGPASPELVSRPSLTVVIPVHNGGRDFETCLRALRESTWTDLELLVVDDGSSDASARAARASGAVVLSNIKPLGPAAARNLGAKSARGDLIFFLDADVAVHPSTIERAYRRFQADPSLDALFGSYDDRPEKPGVVSRFRNLLHHYVHQSGSFEDEARPAVTFWTGCGAIRRETFLKHGGFDPRLYRRPAIEDIELGDRIVRAGGKISLVRDLLATHLKRWTLFEMIRTDIFRRGVPWMLLLKRQGQPRADLNVSAPQKLSVAATGLAILSALGIGFVPALFFLTLICLGLVLALNAQFYRFLLPRLGLVGTLASFPLHLLYFCCCGASVVLANAYWYTRGRSRRHVHEAIPRPLGALERSRQRTPSR